MGIWQVSAGRMLMLLPGLDIFKRKTRLDGKFRNADLAEILQNATQEVAGAFKARGVPECMRAIEILGIEQSREWGVCSVRSPESD